MDDVVQGGGGGGGKKEATTLRWAAPLLSLALDYFVFFASSCSSAARAAAAPPARDISRAYTIPPASVATSPPHATTPLGARPPKPHIDPITVNTLTPLLSAMKLVADKRCCVRACA
jgi:hypothetical protein